MLLTLHSKNGLSRTKFLKSSFRVQQESVAFWAQVNGHLLVGACSSTNPLPDIEYFNPWRRRTNYRKHQVDDRIFYVRKYKETLTQIDRPKPAGALIAHPSESGWRLPRTHKRHFLNFPAGKYLRTK
jgi:hypothetical protein